MYWWTIELCAGSFCPLVCFFLLAALFFFPVHSFCGFCYRINRSLYTISYNIQIVIFVANVTTHRSHTCALRTHEICFAHSIHITWMHILYSASIYSFIWMCMTMNSIDRYLIVYEVMRSIYAIRLIFNFRLQFNWDHYIYLCVCVCMRLYICLHALVTCITHIASTSLLRSFFNCRRSNWYRSIVKWHKKDHKFQNEIHNVIICALRTHAQHHTHMLTKPMLNTPMSIGLC